jgi:hypothetical protein
MASCQLMRSVFSLWRQTPVVQSSLLVVSPETRIWALGSHAGRTGPPPAPPPPSAPVVPVAPVEWFEWQPAAARAASASPAAKG